MVLKEVTRSGTEDEGSAGAEEEETLQGPRGQGGELSEAGVGGRGCDPDEKKRKKVEAKCGKKGSAVPGRA